MQTLARWSIRRRRAVIALWVVLLVGSLGMATGLKNHFVNNLTLPHTDAQRATDLLNHNFPSQAGDSDHIVFHTTRGTLEDVATRARITKALRAVARSPHVTGVVSPFRDPHAISRSDTIGFATVEFDERGDALPTHAVERVIRIAQSARASK
jgi:RND superfamily putative drug exporter